MRERRTRVCPRRRLLELARQRVQRVLGADPTDELDAQRKPVRGDAGGDRDRRLAGDVEERRPRREPRGLVEGRERAARRSRPRRRSAWSPAPGVSSTSTSSHKPRIRAVVLALCSRSLRARRSGTSSRPAAAIRLVVRSSCEGSGTWSAVLVDPAQPGLRELDRHHPVCRSALDHLVAQAVQQPGRPLPRAALVGRDRRDQPRRDLPGDGDPQARRAGSPPRRGSCPRTHGRGERRPRSSRASRRASARCLRPSAPAARRC